MLVGDRIVEAGTHDLVRVPPLTWHQFQPAGDAPLGFLCMVDCDRDVPERPDAEALAALRRDPASRGVHPGLTDRHGGVGSRDQFGLRAPETADFEAWRI